MRQFFIAVMLVFGIAGSAAAQDSGPRTAIETVIGAQNEAFQADDVDRAFTYASPSIRQIFRTPENFGAMVRQGYPMVWRPSEVQFLGHRERAGRLWQVLRITDGKGAVHLLEYQMIETETGWKINGVRILDAPGVAA